MYRSYRMRYGEDPIGQDPIDGYVDYKDDVRCRSHPLH